MVGKLNFFHYRAKSPMELPGEKINNKHVFKDHMKGILRVLFFEGRMYSDDEELVKEIEELFEIYKKDNVDRMKVLEDIRLKVSKLMQDAGLGLPRKKNVDPEKAWKEGL